ncbi:MAG: monosaccharide transporter rane proteinCUT2 family [Chthonomonadaceae bacterium]|nr:monosaccharide transporter rane proteinCUT2 family [Chthonomonadaceae bacterium]
MPKVSNPPDSIPVTGGAGPRKSFAAQLLASRETSVLAVLLLLILGMSVTSVSSKFFSSANLQQMAFQVALLSIFAIGETIVIISGGIDLSLGSLIAFSGMMLAFLVNKFDTRMFTGGAIALAIAMTLLASWLIGAVHTVLIQRVKLPAFVVTLTSLLVLRSQSLVMNHHQQIPVDQEKFPLFNWLTNGKLFAGASYAIPIPVILMIVIAVAAHLVLAKTRMGRYLYSVGSNEQATMLSGVNVFKVKLFAYGTSALLGGIAGLLYMGYGGQGDPSAGASYELDAVAAAVVGGASLAGGQGSVMGTVLGACLLNAILSVILLTLDQPDIWRGTIVGGVLLVAVLATAFQQRKR